MAAVQSMAYGIRVRNGIWEHGMARHMRSGGRDHERNRNPAAGIM